MRLSFARLLTAMQHATAKAQYEAAESGIKDKGAASEEKKAAVQQMKADEARARKELATAQAQEQVSTSQYFLLKLFCCAFQTYIAVPTFKESDGCGT